MVLSSKFARWLGWMILGRQLSSLRTQGAQHSVEKSIEGSFIPAHSPESIVLCRWWAGGRALLGAVSHVCSLPTAGSTKYFGTAKARYDFCARDRSELSLKEGDIIKILNKKGQQGWWRGEIYGRVSWGGARQL